MLQARAQLGPMPLAGQSVTAKGATAAQPLSKKLGETLSLLDFGAACDGSTDDSAALAAASASGVSVNIPSGLLCRGASVGEGNLPPLVGPGQVETADGVIHAPVVMQVNTPQPAPNDGSVTTAFANLSIRVPFTGEQWLTGNALAAPSTGYLVNDNTSLRKEYSYNASGGNTSTVVNDGRTGAAAYSWHGYQAGGGDLSWLGGSCYVVNPSAANAAQNGLTWPGCSLFSGSVFAGANGSGLQGIGDINLTDNGYLSFATALNFNLTRTHAVGNATQDVGWMGIRVQSNQSTVPIDAAFSAAGSFKVVFDAASAGPLSPAAMALKAGQKIYGNVAQPIVSNGAYWPWNINLGTEYLDYNATSSCWEFQAGGVQVACITGGSGSNVSAGYSLTNTGKNAVALGGYSVVGGAFGVALGGAHVVNGSTSSAIGLQASDHGNAGAACAASGEFGEAGDAQTCRYVLRAATSSTAPARLTSDGNAPSSTNCVNILYGFTYGLDIHIVARDTTVASAWSDWRLPQALLTHDTVGTVLTAAPPTQISAGAGAQGAAAAVALAADGTNACLSISFTAPNSDAWHVVASVTTTEAGAP
jgi:hypothetical protein